ncbi:unnamed protein product [Paramecium octaurelia]|uniref:Uncharacterized protein n=1 Tax=Paramecium octaurelia TaxID=43137 RepID=A0A8S1SV16_PAROT|nr:unnamed protein product [Paramecium octaurelia]
MNNFCFYHDGLLEDREKYFKQDIINFIGNVLAYMREKNIEILSYQHFNKCWMENDIHFIHQCQLEWESQDDYYNLLYGIILNKLIESPLYFEQLSLFYLIYTIYVTLDQKILISLDQETMNQLYFFFQECKEKGNHDVFLLFLELNKQNAFLLSSRVGCKRLSIHPCGLPYIITKRNKAQLKQITEEREDEQEKVERAELTKQLLNASEKYHKAKQKQNIKLKSTDPHFAQRCIHTFSNINQKQ